MPRHSSHIMELARRGAGHRLAELEAEIAALLKSFPHLRSTRSGRRGRKPQIDRSAEPAATIDQPKRKRRRKPMSVAARNAVSLRMKKYWDARRAKKG